MRATDGIDEDDEGRGDDEVLCRFCGQGPFTWLHTGVRWRLTDEDGHFHECRNMGSADDFEVVKP